MAWRQLIFKVRPFLIPSKETQTTPGLFRFFSKSTTPFIEVEPDIYFCVKMRVYVLWGPHESKDMLELEKMREDFHRELELQKKQILEKAEAEIAKNRDANDDDEDTGDDSAENLSE